MAKEQKRSNRELKKPKKAKPAAAISSSLFQDKKPAGTPSSKKKG